MDGAICKPCIAGCKSCTDATCSTGNCMSNFFLSSGACTKCDESCLTCIKATECTTCSPGYDIDTTSKKCIKTC